MVGFLWALKNTKFEFKSQGYSWSSLRLRPITLCHESSGLPAANEENITNWPLNFATKEKILECLMALILLLNLHTIHPEWQWGPFKSQCHTALAIPLFWPSKCLCFCWAFKGRLPCNRTVAPTALLISLPGCLSSWGLLLSLIWSYSIINGGRRTLYFHGLGFIGNSFRRVATSFQCLLFVIEAVRST